MSDDFQSFKAHKLVLSAFSKVIERLLLISSKEHTVLHLRGFCLQTSIEHTRYTPMHLHSDPRDIVMVGKIAHAYGFCKGSRLRFYGKDLGHFFKFTKNNSEFEK